MSNSAPAQAAQCCAPRPRLLISRTERFGCCIDDKQLAQAFQLLRSRVAPGQIDLGSLALLARGLLLTSTLDRPTATISSPVPCGFSLPGCGQESRSGTISPITASQAVTMTALLE